MADLSGLTTNFFPTPKEGFTTTISGTVDSSTDTEIPLNSVSGLNNGDIFTGLIDPGNAKERAFTGVVDTGGSQITNVVFTTGSNATHTAGATVVDYVTSTHIAQMTKGIKVSHDNDGTLKAGAVDNAAVLASDVVTTAKILDANVTTAKIADGDVTSEKLGSTVAFYATTAQSISSSAAVTDLTTYTEVFDYGSDFNHTTGIFTAPYAGVYYFSATMSYTNPSNATSRNGIFIYVGSTAIAGQTTHLPSTNHDPIVNCSAIYALAANDTVKVGVYQDGGASETLITPSNFNGYLVGRTD